MSAPSYRTIVYTAAAWAIADAFGSEWLRELDNLLAQNPEIGDRIPGTNGARKLRQAIPGIGKRGGARVIYYEHEAAEVVYVFAIYAKADATGLSVAGKRMVATIIREIEATVD
jgi:plasmid stabilization system protein ParE